MEFLSMYAPVHPLHSLLVNNRSLLVSIELDRQTCRLILTDMNALDCVWHLCCVWGA